MGRARLGPARRGRAGAQRSHRVRTSLLIGVPLLAAAVVAGMVIGSKTTGQVNVSPTVAKAACVPARLSSCLIAAPVGAGTFSGSWAQDTAVTAAQYAGEYPDAADQAAPSGVTGQLTADGVHTIVHHNWYDGDDQIDIVLLDFATAQGAQAWALDRTGEFLAQGGGPTVAVPGDETGKAYAAAAPDSIGNVPLRYITTVGTVDLEIHYASTGSLQTPDFSLWAGAQYASLAGLPAPAATPTPTATAFQPATCPLNLAGCLMPLPSGGVAWFDPALPSTFSPSDFSSRFFSGDAVTAADVTQELQNEHVVQIANETWGLNGLQSQAELVLLQTRTEAQATALMQYLGTANPRYPNAFTISGYPAAVAGSASSTDSGGFTDGLVSAQVGTVVMQLWSYTYGSTFSTSNAQSWAGTELALLTKDTQPSWGVPIPQVTPPTLAAFAPGAKPAGCTAAAPGACLLPLPSGATKSSGSESSAATAVTGADYAKQVYPDAAAYQQEFLAEDGMRGGAAESFTAADGANATIYVLGFGSARAAQAAAARQAGDSTAGAQSCAVASLADAYCLVLPEDDATGAIPVRVVAAEGGFEVDVELDQTDSADVSDALNWAQGQMELLGAAG